MRKIRTCPFWVALFSGICGITTAVLAFRYAPLPAVDASGSAAEPAPGSVQSRWSGTYKVTAIAPRGSATLTITDTGTLLFSIDGIHVTGTLKGYVEDKMTGLFATQGATHYTATLLGIVRKASELPQIPKGLNTSGDAVTVNESRPTPASFPMSGVFGIPPNTHPYNAQQPSPDWPLIILLGDGRTTDYDIPTNPILPGSGHVTITIHRQP